ncbi:cobalamin B12-binding domain protein [Candidatus Moduliflexus flocculans]|uniref:Cobalamin B12-binding domain protein n=1 Tax=Candidatus Moduliflexus flocculans TaxID=1499966 RepID=A0A081BRJ1_9BACT|nr:cobalamin B12-binding domain protein [Candidatus Moduliflexus flocculans]
MAILDTIYQSVIDGNLNGATTGVNAALAEGIAPAEILNKGLIAAMTEVGRLFEEGEYFVPEMLISARAMQASVAILKPKLKDADVKPLGKIAIGTVKGDLHDIGKNLVAMMLEGTGFEIIDLGTDVPPEKFVDAVKTHDVGFIGMSALLTTTMPAMRTTIEALKAAGVRDRVKVMVGGAPITQEFAKEIGADLYAQDGPSAARNAKISTGANA